MQRLCSRLGIGKVLGEIRGGKEWRRSFAESAKERDYDVVIVGAGMVGAALASSLSASPLTASLRVALLDAKVPPNTTKAPLGMVPEMRVSTLTPATMRLLQRCGAWDPIAPPNSAQKGVCSKVWDYDSGGYLRWSARQVGHEDMGYVAENSLIQSALIDSLTPNARINCMFPVAIESITFPSHFGNELAIIRLEGGDQLRTRLVVGADGAGSKVRSLAGIRSNGRDYNQRGLVATVEVSDSNATAWQRFLPTGPFALLPVRNSFFNIVWSTTPEVAHAVESANESAAVQAFNEALHGGRSLSSDSESYDLDAFHLPPHITKIAGGPPRSFPLKRQLADTSVSSRLVLVGDAYRVVHPLAGQGVNLGFADVDRLHSTLEEALQSGQDIGDRLLLSAYERNRRVESAVMMTALDTIRDLFGIQARPFQLMRGLGLGALNQSKPLKNEIMLYAMGMKPIPFQLASFTL